MRGGGGASPAAWVSFMSRGIEVGLHHRVSLPPGDRRGVVPSDGANTTSASKAARAELCWSRNIHHLFLGSVFEQRGGLRGSLAGYVEAIRVTYSGWQHPLFYNTVGALTHRAGPVESLEQEICANL